MGGADLNCVSHFSGFSRGGSHVRWQDAFRSTHGFSALEDLPSHCRPVRNHPVSHAGGWLVAMIFIDGAG
jgi:hypothetical protein